MMIFFDIDETLVNQRQAEASAATKFLRDYGDRLPPACDAEEFCRRWRALREKHAPAFLNGSISYDEHHRRRIRDLFLDGAHLSDAECDARYRAFREEYQAAWTLFDDVLPCLDALADHPLGILSNGNAAQQRLKLDRTGILDRFSVVLISEEVGFAKPHRGIFEEGRRRAGPWAGRCLHVGDRLDADARASRAAGLRGVWLNRYHNVPPHDIETIPSLAHLSARLHASPTPSYQTAAAG